MIDLTAHKQPHETSRFIILDEPIAMKENARVLAYKVKSEERTKFARSQVA